MYTVVLFSLQEPNQHIFCSMVMTPAAFLYRDHPSTFLMMCVPIVSLTYKMYMGLMYGNLLVETSRRTLVKARWFYLTCTIQRQSRPRWASSCAWAMSCSTFSTTMLKSVV